MVQKDFTRVDLENYLLTKTVMPVFSCFGGTAIYRSDVWHNPNCRYYTKTDDRYSYKHWHRTCEHVAFHECLYNTSTTAIKIGVASSMFIQRNKLPYPSHLIPQRLVFTYRTNILETKRPKLLYKNVLESINRYRKSWNAPNTVVDFLNDTDCRAVIQRIEPALTHHFDTEEREKYKEDICRIATLYENGGYYLDLVLQVVDPPTFDSPVTFAMATVLEPSHLDPGFFETFLATTPGHPVLRAALNTMLEYYNDTRTLRMNMSTSILKDAYIRANSTTTVILQESRLTKNHNVPKQNGKGCCCNYVVHNRQNHVHFYSRIVGTKLCSSH